MTQTHELPHSEATPCTDSQSATSPPETEAVVVTPRVDVYESADGWVLRAEMPGVDETHAEVSLEMQTLTIAGHVDRLEPEGYQRQFGQFRPRRYERAFKLPAAIDRAGLEATVRHGVLTVRIPKAREAQPTKITVRGV